MKDNSATIAGRAFPSQWVTRPTPFLAGREKTVDRLLYGLFHHRRIQLLSGPAGAGKSIALRRLEERLRDRLLTVCVDAADIADQHALLRQLGDATDSYLGNQPSTGNGSGNGNTAADMVDAIDTRLRQLGDDGQQVLLLVDNAGQLDADSIEHLLQLAHTEQPTSATGALGIVLACLPEFAGQHTDRRHWQPVVLKPLTLAGTGRYLQARLGRAGIRGHGPFNRSTVEDIHAQTGGWPGAIDQQARELLGDSSHHLLNTEITLGRPSRTIIGLLLLVMLTAAGWWYRQPLRELASGMRFDINTGQSKRTAGQHNPGEPAAVAAPTNAAQASDPAPQATVQPGSGSIIGGIGNAGTIEPAAEPTTPAPASASPAATHSDHPRNTAPSAVETAAPAPAAEAKAENQPTPTPKTATPTSAIIHLQNWIEQQAPQRWTLQVFTANSESHLLNLVSRSTLPGDWAYYHIRQNDKDWYTLLFGSFASRNAASKAVPALKPLFGQPLLRNFAGIHKSLGITP